MGETLFVSDLHLEAKRQAMTDLFLRFLRERAPAADALYILGDLFEIWIGDDGAVQHDLDIQSGLKTLAQSGVPIYYLLGNRDFLMGDEFAFDSGMKLIPDPSLVDLYGTRSLLMHGDSLCTDDAEYMAFRHLARSTAWQDGFLQHSLDGRRKIARGLREKSERLKQLKSSEIMDVNPKAVQTTYITADVRHLIHGHTHREALHETQLEGLAHWRYVLGDWTDTRGSVLSVSPQRWELQAFE